MSKKNGKANQGNKWGSNVDKAAYTTIRFKPRTDKQAEAIETIRANQLNFLKGVAGTAKTILLCVRAMELFQAGKINKIVLVRPAVEAGKSLGYLPGTQEEKMYPYLLPIYDNLEKIADTYVLESMIENEQIEVLSPTLARGRTLDNAYVIIDEAQNLSREHLRMMLTRLGENTYCGVTLDPGQVDINPKNSSVLDLEIFRGIEGIGIIEFGTEDIVRSPLAKLVMEQYDKQKAAEMELTENG